MSNSKDNKNSKNKNNEKKAIFIESHYDNNPSIHDKFEDIMGGTVELKERRKKVKTKVGMGYESILPLRDALNQAADELGISKSELMDRYLVEALKRDFPEIYADFEAAREKVVFRPLGRPTKPPEDDGSDPVPT